MVASDSTKGELAAAMDTMIEEVMFYNLILSIRKGLQ